MSDNPVKSGLAAVNNAHIYYETAGEGPPFVMIHAGVADSRQWNNEFAHFADRFQVVRYDCAATVAASRLPASSAILPI
jgi:3-oxoadipate enol-lactonase